ncbi:MAG: phosphatase PAP2 family protein [Gemmatimonadaceae bacterium]
MTRAGQRLWFRRRGDTTWTWAWVIGGYLAAVIAGALFAQLMRRTGNWNQGLSWERELMLAMHVRWAEPLDSLLLVLPWLGTNITLIPLVVVVAIWLVAKRDRPDLAMHLVVVQLGSFTLNAVLKDIFDRPRPELWEARGQHAWAAFPSGHAIASVSVLLTAALLLRLERGWRWPMRVAAVLLVFSLYSRLYLGVHWPTDVVGGVIVGFVWLATTYIAFRRPHISKMAPGAGDESPAPGG